jgi:hypothetical protein
MPLVPAQFKCGTRILRAIHGQDARATLASVRHQQVTVEINSSISLYSLPINQSVFADPFFNYLSNKV